MRFARTANRGMTLIDVVVGASLMLVVFIGVAGAFQLTVDVVTNNKARAGAIALGNERLEYLRSLPYASVGTVGGIPAGPVPQTEALTFNGIQYTRTVFVAYADDPKDGTGGSDTNGITADYKVVRVDLSWRGKNGIRHIAFVGRISPLAIEQAVPGGTLVIRAVDANVNPVVNASVTLVNPSTIPAVNLTSYTDITGTVTLIGAPAGAGYQVSVSKAGYSSAQTYSTTVQNTNPSPTHLTVVNNQTTQGTFAIDVVATKVLQTFAVVRTGTTTDQMNGLSGIASSTNMNVGGGTATLSGAPGSYPTYGLIQSSGIVTSPLVRWKSLSWVAAKPAQTTLVFRIYDGSGGALIPDAQLPGNAAGFTTSPVNISGISTSTYPSLRIHGALTSSNPSATPSIDSWSLSYDYGPTSLGNVAVTFTGAKTIGAGPGGAIYKYSTTTTTDVSGERYLGGLEWDSYTVASASSTLDISSACSPQPEALAPNALQYSRFIFSPHTTNSLLVDVKYAGVTVPNATVRLYRVSSSYDTSVVSDSCGQSFFSNLSTGAPGTGNAYSVSVTAAGHTTYTSTTVTVNGTSRLSVVIN